MRQYLRQELRRRPGQYAMSVIVLALLAAFSEVLLGSVEVLSRVVRSLESGGSMIEVVLTMVAWIFLGIAIVVTALVVFNAFGMVYAGRLRDYAVIRLIGGKSSRIRRASGREGAVIGFIGGVVGLLFGAAIIWFALAVLNHIYHWKLTFPLTSQLVVVPIIVPVLAAWIAANKASRQVAQLHPADGMRQASTQHDPGRPRLWGLWLFIVGTVVMVLGLRVGLVTVGAGLLIAFPGGVLSIVGVVGSAQWFVPKIVSVIAWVFPGTIGKVGVANVQHDRVRTARTTISVIVGVALLTMFVVAGSMLIQFLQRMFALQHAKDTEAAIQTINGFLVCVDLLVGFSVLIAVLGMASSLVTSVLQRRQEIGTLRALGMRRGQVRRMLTVESLLVTLVGVVTGLVLGFWFGYVGANALFASTPVGTLPPIVSPIFIAGVVVLAFGLGIGASLAPSRAALRVQPADALRVL